MKISYRITAETYVEAQKLHAAKGAPTSLRILKFVFLPFFLLIGAITVVWGSFAANSWGMLMLGIFWTVLSWIYPPWQWKRMYAKDRRFQGEYTADISEEGIRSEGPTSDGNVKWGFYTRFLESDKLFLLYQSPQLFNMVPKSAFGPGEADQFRELLKRKLLPRNSSETAQLLT